MAFDSLRVWFTKPRETINLCDNPSFETGTGGWTATGASASGQAIGSEGRGIYSFYVTPNTGVDSTVYTELITGTDVGTYWFSIDIKGADGIQFQVGICASGSSTPSYGSVTFTASGEWYRAAVSGSLQASTTYRLIVKRLAVSSTARFDVDGAQFEYGARSTYIDGDLIGYDKNERGYKWNGTISGSASTRFLHTAHGGEMIDVSSYANIVSIIGLGTLSPEHVTLPLANGGSAIQDLRYPDRDVTIVLQVTGSSYHEINDKKQVLWDAVNPEQNRIKQPTTVYIETLSSGGSSVLKTVVLRGYYKSGFDNPVMLSQKAEILPITFTVYGGYLDLDNQGSASLGGSSDWTGWTHGAVEGGYFGFKKKYASYSAPSLYSAIVYDVLVHPTDGYVYFAGAFTGGVKRYNPSTGVVSALSGSDLNGAAYCLACDPKTGDVYIGGAFTTANGTTVNRICKYTTGGVYATVGPGTPVGFGATNIFDIEFDRFGNYLYIVGDFTATAAGATMNRFSRLDIAANTYSGLGTGANAACYVVKNWNDTTILVGGALTSINSVTVSYICTYNGSVWAAMGTLETAVRTIAVDDKKVVYVNGLVAARGTTTSNWAVGYWTGSKWMALDDVYYNGLSSGNFNPISILYWDSKTGTLYIGGCMNYMYKGYTNTTNPTALYGGLVEYRGGNYFQTPVKWENYAVDGTYGIRQTDIKAVHIGPDGEFAFCGAYKSSAGTSKVATAGGTNAVTNYGAPTNPVFLITGAPSYLRMIHNRSTDSRVEFVGNGLQIESGERVRLIFDEKYALAKVVSSRKGELTSQVISGSDMNLKLKSGVNYVECFADGSIYSYWDLKITGIERA